MEMLMLGTTKLIAIGLILVMIAKNRNEVPLDDPFFESQPWTLRDAYTILIPVLALVGVQFAGYYALTGANLHWSPIQPLFPILYTVACGLYYLCIHRPYKPTWSTFGLDRFKFLTTGVRHINISGAILILVLLVQLLESSSPAHSGTPAAGMTPVRIGTLFLFLGMIVGVPVIEELVFRGILYTPVARRLGSWKAMAFLALVFDGMYLDRDGVETVLLYAVGFFLYYGYAKSRSLWVPIIWHVWIIFGTFKPGIAYVLAPIADSATLDRWYLCSVVLGLIVINVWRHMYLRRHGLSVDLLTTMHIKGFLPDSGVCVHRVTPGSVAEEAGIRKGDVIVEYNHVRWLTAQRLEELTIAARKQPSAVHAVYVREGIEHAVALRPGPLGATVRDVTLLPAPGVPESDRDQSVP